MQDAQYIMKLARRSPIWTPNPNEDNNRKISFQKGFNKWAMACKQCGIWYMPQDQKRDDEKIQQDGPHIEKLRIGKTGRQRKQRTNYLWSSIRVLKKVST